MSAIATAPTQIDDEIATFRRFNRFYTRMIGTLGEHFLDTAYSLTEGRVLYELAHREAATAKDVAQRT